MCVIYPHFERFVFKFLNVKTIFFFTAWPSHTARRGGRGGHTGGLEERARGEREGGGGAGVGGGGDSSPVTRTK